MNSFFGTIECGGGLIGGKSIMLAVFLGKEQPYALGMALLVARFLLAPDVPQHATPESIECAAEWTGQPGLAFDSLIRADIIRRLPVGFCVNSELLRAYEGSDVGVDQ